MKKRTKPDISIILVTPDDFESIRMTVAHLGAQTIKDRIEIIVIAPSEKELKLDRASMGCFYGYTIVEFDVKESIARAKVEGIYAASADIVAFTEDHSFPEPGFAEALLNAHHSGDYAVVGPAIKNANPATSVSWAHLLLEYSIWLAPAKRECMNFLPGKNSSFKRSVLIEEYGDKLVDLFDEDYNLHLDLHSKGYKLLLEPDAVTRHMNYSIFPFSITLRYICGRAFAGARILEWPISKRLLYVFGSPLIPLLRLSRILRSLNSRSASIDLPGGALPMLALFLIIDGIGQTVGYIFGPGKADSKKHTLIFHRSQHLSSEDKKEIILDNKTGVYK
ncbi:MAG: glycosyltransferase [Thermodesulfobacteriota bacterium]